MAADADRCVKRKKSFWNIASFDQCYHVFVKYSHFQLISQGPTSHFSSAKLPIPIGSLKTSNTHQGRHVEILVRTSR